MDGKSRRTKGRLRDVHPEADEDEGADSTQVASSSRIPPPPSQLPPKRLGGVPPPPSFGPPAKAAKSKVQVAFEEAAGGSAVRSQRKRKGKRQRATPLLGKAKAPAGLESDSSEGPEDDASKAATSSGHVEVQETGFFQTLWQGAAAAIGVVSDIVTAINAETDSEEEKHAEGEASETREAVSKKAKSSSKAEEEEQYIEYVSQFCLYLGIDAAAEPELITEVDDYLKRPLPQGWSTHQTTDDCEYGAGYTYFMNASTGHTQWTRPDEDEFLQHLRSKMKRKPTAGSRLFFAEFRDRNRREKWAALEDQIDHLSGVRPLLRALPEGSPEPTETSSTSIFHVVLHNRFPVLYPTVVEAFATYFGLGTMAQFAAAELRHFWVPKIAALCPVPNGWEFKFDETSSTAVFVDQAAGTASRHHPMDAFFAGLLERLLSRHRSVEAAESQRLGEAVALGSQMVFFLDSRSGTPFWMQYGAKATAWTGPMPWQTSKHPVAAKRDLAPAEPQRQAQTGGLPPVPRGPAAQPKAVAAAAAPAAPQGPNLRDAAQATPKYVDPLRHAAGGGGAQLVPGVPDSAAPLSPPAPPPAAGPATPKAPETPKAPATPKQEVEALAEEVKEEKETPRQEQAAESSEESEAEAEGAEGAQGAEGEVVQEEEVQGSTSKPEADPAAEAPVDAAPSSHEEEMIAAPSATLVPKAEEPPEDADSGDAAPVVPREVEETLESTLPQPEAEPVAAPDAAPHEEATIEASASPAQEDVEAPVEAPVEVHEPELPGEEGAVSTLFSLAQQLQQLPGDAEPQRIVELLEQLESIPATVELLRQTQLGVISQPFKDHDDPNVRKVAKRLRRSWKDLIAATANEVSMPPSTAFPEAQHGMVPPEKEEELTVEQEAEKLLKEMEEINTKLDSPKLQAKVGGTEDATDLFGATPRETPLEHVGAPKHLLRPTSAQPKRQSAVQDADEVFGKSPREGYRETPLEHVGAPKHLLRPTSAQARRPSLEEVLSGSASSTPAKGTFARAATLSLNPLSATPLPAKAAPAPPKQLPKAPGPPKQLPAAKPAPQVPSVPKALPAGPPPKAAEKVEPVGREASKVAAPAPEPPPAAQAPEPPAEAPEPSPVASQPEAPEPPVEADPSSKAASDASSQAASDTPPAQPKRVMALLPPAPLPPAPAPAPAPAQPPLPKTGSPSRKKPSMAPLPPVPEMENQAQASQEASSESSEELLPETPVAKGAAKAAPVASGYPQREDAPAATSGGYPPKAELPSRPQPQINAGLPQARRQRAELVSNLQYLCRLFLETREQLYAAHEGTETEANCDGLREELDAVRFRRLLEETLGSQGALPKPLIRLLRSFGRRALYGRRRSPYGRRAFAQFQQVCTNPGPKGFVLGAVPQILRLMDRLVDEGRRTMSDAVEDGGDDPWLDGMPEEIEGQGKGLPDWEKLDGILSEPQNLESLQAEADAFLAETSKPRPLCLSKAERDTETAAPPDSGSFAPRGRRPARGDAGADASAQGGRRLFAPVAPYYSCEPALLLKVAKAPLPNLDTLVNSLVPGAEITTEGLLLQLADEELVLMAYALEQIAEAASKRLVKDLETRDELRSTCMHRREYLQLLEGALSRR